MPVSRFRLLFLVGWFVLGIADAENILDFPGPVSCSNGSMKITLPQLLGGSSWQQLYIIDSEGEEMDCDYVVDREHLQMTAYNNCMEYEGTSPRLTIQLLIGTDAEYRKISYEVTCQDEQGDNPYVSISDVTCSANFMSIPVSHTLAPFQGERAASIVPFTWYLELTDSKGTYNWDIAEAWQHGYRLSNDEANNLLIQAFFNCTGLQVFKQDDQTLYLADIGLIYYVPNVRIRVDASMICVPGPYPCNETHLVIMIPSFPGKLHAVNIDMTNIPMNQLMKSGITLDTKNGIKLYIDTTLLKKKKCSTQPQSFVSTLKLTFNLNGKLMTMVIHPECPCLDDYPPVVSGPMCSADGFMDFEVAATSTIPNLNLDTVRVRDPSCLPDSTSTEMVTFHIPLNGCGTTLKYEGLTAVYENEVRALWVDLPASIISRDSEFRMTVRCVYNDGDAAVGLSVVTPLLPVTLARSQGPITLILNIFPDRSYTNPYSQFPVVKLLREPIYLEVELLNRNDPNIELKLNNCWATASQEPMSVPRWNVIVDGCSYQNDNYKTLFSPVSQVQFPSHHKRFEVKTFAFVSGDAALSSPIYFHCTALVCNMLAPDSPLCSKMCPTSRRRRENALSYKDILVSLPGPVLFEDSEFSRKSEDPMAPLSTDEFPADLKVAWSVGIVSILLCFVVMTTAILKWRKTLLK